MPEIPPPSRNELALHRTFLANERTLLAYGRSAIMLAASGVTLWKLDAMNGEPDSVLATGLIVAAAVVAVIGCYRFYRMRRALAG